MNERPEQPYMALFDADLLSPAVMFEDPFVFLEGPALLDKYWHTLRCAGAWFELDEIWLEMSKHRYTPQC